MNAIIVFAKAPVPGRTKTRLIPALGPEGAARIHAAFIRDVVARHQHHALTVWTAGDHEIWAELGVPTAPQPQGDLGARMDAAFRQTLQGAGRVFILGTDSPSLPPRYVDDAFAALADNDVVVGPACDGGYWGLGLRAPQPQLFEDMPWGTADVLQETLTRLARTGLKWAVLPFWYDVDRPADLALLRAHLPALVPQPEHTRAALDVSDYCATLERLFGLTRFGEKLDLSTPRALNRALGSPLDAYRSVLVAGTNGKGSTSAMLAALLRAAGLRVGLFTSPHLVSFRERIRIDGADIAPDQVVRLVPKVLEAGHQPSFFEATWATAALAFAEADVDVVVWEVGLGGRLDATNTAEPEVSAVVDIGFDHTHVLGSRLVDIAREKAGVFRPGRPALTAARGHGIRALRSVAPQVVRTRPYLGPVPLPGAHQARNAGLALAIAEALGVTPNPTALSGMRWPGRAERIGNVVLDCAHNAHAMRALAEWLGQRARGPVDLVFGAMADKDVRGMAAALRPHVVRTTLVTPAYPRRALAQSLARFFPDATIGDRVADALDQRSAGTTLVTGSGFLVGEARAHLLGLAYPECGLSTIAR